MKNITGYFYYSIFAIFLAGCTTQGSHSRPQWLKDVAYYSDRGQCSDAIHTLENAPIDFTWKLAFKADVYQYCYRDMDKYYAYLTLAARYGEKTSAEALLKHGKPVPPADLATTRQPQMSEIEALLIGISRGVEKNTRTPSITNCDFSSSGKSVSCTNF